VPQNLNHTDDKTNHRIPRVSILVPTLNEAGNIALLLDRIFAVVEKNGLAAEVLVVDGGSTDGTQACVQDCIAENRIRLIQADGTRGLAGDILTAAQSARGEFVVVLDADLSHPPEVIPQLLEPLLAGTHDMAVASRYMRGGSMRDWPWIRWLVSRTATMLVRPLVSVKDPMSGFFAVKREMLLRLASGMSGFKIALEILGRSDDSLRVTEVPIVFQNRIAGRSKFGIRQVKIFLSQLAALCGAAAPAASSSHFTFAAPLVLVLDVLLFEILLYFRLNPIFSQAVSFFAAMITYSAFFGRKMFAEFAKSTGTAPWRLWGRLWLVSLLVFLLRSAIFMMIVMHWQWPVQAAILSAASISAGLFFLAAVLFVFVVPAAGGIQRSRWCLITLSVFSYVLLLKLAFLGLVNVIPEEAYYWNYAQHLDIGYLDHPPLVAWLIWISTSWFGHSEFAVRLPALISWLIASVFMFRLTLNLQERPAAFRSVLLMAVLPIYFGVGFFITPDAPLHAAWAACLYFLERALIGADRRSWLGVGICVGLGLLAKYTFALLGLGTLIFVLFDTKARRWLVRPQPFVAALVALILFSPVLFWNLQNGWASFVFQGTRRWDGNQDFSLHLIFASLFLVLTPVGVLSAGKILLSARDSLDSHRTEDRQRKKRLWLFSFTAVPLAVFVIQSLQNEPKLHWTGPVFLAAIPFIAGDMLGRADEITRPWVNFFRRAWLPTIVVLLLSYGSVFHYLGMGLPGLSMSEKRAFGAWRQVGERVGQLEQALEVETGAEPLIVGMDKYMISSELSFYDLSDRGGTHNMAGPHLFGGRSNMWEYWLPRSAAIGRNLLLIEFDSKKLTDPFLAEHFDRMSEVSKETLKKDGRIVGSFHWRVGYNYRDPCAKIHSATATPRFVPWADRCVPDTLDRVDNSAVERDFATER
jgi:dolichol-phosphate mannosyltransferase